MSWILALTLLMVLEDFDQRECCSSDRKRAECAVVLEVLAWSGNTFLVLDFGFDVVDGVRSGHAGARKPVRVDAKSKLWRAYGRH